MQLRVLTLNVWSLPFGIARHVEPRMLAIGERLESLEADLVAFQEVWTERAQTLLARAGRAAGYENIWRRPQTFGGSGLMVLSRIPLLGAEFTHYRLAGLPQRPQHADYYGGKGFAELTLDTPHGPVSVINTHLHAGYNPLDQPDEYVGIRAAQATQLALSIRETRAPVIALGDFNCEEGEAAYQILLGLSDLEDAAATLDQRQATITSENPYSGKNDRDARIDLVLTRRGTERSLRPLSIRRVLDEELAIDGNTGSYSDHAGVLADLELARTPQAVSLPAPIRPQELSRAFEQLDLGREISRQRHVQEVRYAGSGLGLGLLGSAGAWGAHRSRRQLVFRLATVLASLGFLGASGLYLGSRRICRNEEAGYRELSELLHQLQPSRPRRDTMPSS